jgi:nucleotide-binding universal stress UspA family protein
VVVDVTSLRGDPTESLIAFATDCHAGLIACGRLAHSFVERLFVSSVSSDLVRRATCPVLVVPEQPGDRRIC